MRGLPGGKGPEKAVQVVLGPGRSGTSRGGATGLPTALGEEGWPLHAPRTCSGVLPSSAYTRGSAPSFRSTPTAARWPPKAARYSGVRLKAPCGTRR